MGTFLDMFVSYNSLPSIVNEKVEKLRQPYDPYTYDETYKKKYKKVEEKQSDIIRPIEDITEYSSQKSSSKSSKYKQVRAMSTLSNSKGLNKNAEIAYNYLVQSGIPKKSAAGIVGNLYHENLGNPTQTVNDSHGTKAYGIAGFNNEGDLPNLLRWSQNNNIQGMPGFEAQLAYIADVAKHRNPNLTSVIMNPESSPEDASYAWGRYFEVFGGKTTRVGKNGKIQHVGYLYRNDPEHVKRGQTAAALFKKFNG